MRADRFHGVSTFFDFIGRYFAHLSPSQRRIALQFVSNLNSTENFALHSIRFHHHRAMFRLDFVPTFIAIVFHNETRSRTSRRLSRFRGSLTSSAYRRNAGSGDALYISRPSFLHASLSTREPLILAVVGSRAIIRRRQGFLRPRNIRHNFRVDLYGYQSFSRAISRLNRGRCSSPRSGRASAFSAAPFTTTTTGRSRARQMQVVAARDVLRERN